MIFGLVLVLLGIGVPIATWFFVDSWFWWLIIAAAGAIAALIGLGALLFPLLKYAVLA